MPKYVQTVHEKIGVGWTCTGSKAKTFYAIEAEAQELLDLLKKFVKYNPGKRIRLTLLPNNEQKYRHELPPWNFFFNYDQIK